MKLAPYVAGAFFLSACYHRPQIRQIEILSETGPWPERTSSLVVTRKAKDYSANGREVPLALVENLRLSILATPITKLNLNRLGITPLWLGEVGKRALVAFEEEHSIQLPARDQDAFIASFKNEKLVYQAVETALLPHTDDRPAMKVDIRLEDGEKISLSSHSQYAFMLPWMITVNGKSVLTYDPQIARALERILPTGFPNSERLTDQKLKLDVAYFFMRHNEHLLKSVSRRRQPRAFSLPAYSSTPTTTGWWRI